MTMLDRLSSLGPMDAIGVLVTLVLWVFIGWRIENSSASRPAVSHLMAAYRREWMKTMVTRNPRIFDATMLATLRHGTTFFASACLISIGGVLALIGNTERLLGVAQDLSLGAAPALVWEIKLMLVLVFLTNGLLKFIWSHRLFGYCAVLMAAVPNEPDDPEAYPRAAQAAELNISATKAFNRGLRSLYFALAAIAWMVGPVALIVATVFTVVVLWRRDFASTSRQVLLSRPEPKQ